MSQELFANQVLNSKNASRIPLYHHIGTER